MPQHEPFFSFGLSTLEPGALRVVRFTGSEGLSCLYEFEIILMAGRAGVDAGKAFSGQAELAVHIPGGEDVRWKGILREFSESSRVGGQVFYRAVMVPGAYDLTLDRISRVHLDKETPRVLSSCLKDAGFIPDQEFSLDTTIPYPRRDYVCQYNESSFHFLSRWMERNGLYFFFEHTGEREKMRITDTKSAHGPHPAGDVLIFAEPSGLDAPVSGKAVKSFRHELTRLPGKMRVSDYNYRTPHLDIDAQAPVDPASHAEVDLWGGHIRSAKEADFLARVHAQAKKCRQSVYKGTSNAPFVQPGYIFELQGHPERKYHQPYLVMEVRHEGSQEAWITQAAGVNGAGNDSTDKLFYRNSFSAIPATVQFRPEQKTPWPRIPGALKAVVDASGSGKYAELDEQGRYKVIMPFDRSGRKEGKATMWLRMAQPYAGDGHGMHFPLHKGTEVAIQHYEGDPDRPYIASAMPNPRTQSVVTSENQTSAAITTAGGNMLHFEDKDGAQGIHFKSPTGDSAFSIGAPQTLDSTVSNDASPPAGDDIPAALSSSGFNYCTKGGFTVNGQFYNTMILGWNRMTVLGMYSCNVVGLNASYNLGGSVTFNAGIQRTYAPECVNFFVQKDEAAETERKTVQALAEVTGKHIQLIAEQSMTIEEQSRTITTLQETVQQHTAAIENASITYATKTEISEMNEFICTEVANIVTEQNDTLEELTQSVSSLSQRAVSWNATCTRMDHAAAVCNHNFGALTQILENCEIAAEVLNIV